MSTWSYTLGGRILVQMLCGNGGGCDRVEEVRRGIEIARADLGVCVLCVWKGTEAKKKKKKN